MRGNDPMVSPLRYRVCGVTIGSDSPISQLAALREINGSQPLDLRIRRTLPHEPWPSAARWFLSCRLATGTPWLRCAKLNGGYLLRFPKLADFWVEADARTVRYRSRCGMPDDAVHHLLLNQVLPRVLNLQGREAIHATAVLTSFGCCAFIGPTGAGKSTLAASFLFTGYPVLSDDCLGLDRAQGRILAAPAYPGLRLWEPTLEAFGQKEYRWEPIAPESAKRRLVCADHASFPSEPQPLARVYAVLRSDGTEDPVVEPLTCREGFVELLASAFRLDITDRTMLARQFGVLEAVASTVPVRRLHIPNDLGSLPAVRKAILADLEKP